MEYDLLVIGGGSAGLSAAREAKKYVNRVALIESGPLGGTCVNLGCIPKKLFWFASDVWNGANDLEVENWGIYRNQTNSIFPPSFGWENFKQARDQYISRLSNRYEEHLKREGIERFIGKGEFCGENSIEIQTNDSCQKLILNFKHAIIATGSQATIPKEIPGAFVFGKTSDDFFRLLHLPRKAAIIGFGYIGVEIAHLLASLGCETWIIGRGCLPLSSHFDHELSAVALSHLKATKNCHVLCEREISKVHEDCLEFKGNFHPLKELDFILFATGRSPNTAHLHCEKAKIELESERANAIRVDSQHQTTNSRVFAVGDVIGHVMLTPVAISAARSIIKRLYASNPLPVNQNDNLFSYSNIPTVVFSHPPLGSVGLSEREALKEFKSIFVYKTTFLPLQTSFGEVKKEVRSDQINNHHHQPKSSFIKIITTGQMEQIIGIHLAGLAVDELLQGFAVALRMKAKKADFLDCVAIHPTIAEEVIFALSLKPLEIRSE